MSADKPDEVEFIPGSMTPTYPFERRGGSLVLSIYDQEGTLQELCVPDTKGNEIFGVWLRRFDRYTIP